MKFFSELTEREEEILTLVAKGLTNKKIAVELNISVCTVHNHVQSLMRSLGVHNRTAAAALYWQKAGQSQPTEE